MTKQVIPPTPPHLAKGHNCPKPRYSALRSAALQPTPPETSKKQRKGERRTPAPTQGKQTTREIPGSGVRAQPVTTPHRSGRALKSNDQSTPPSTPPPPFIKRTYLSKPAKSHNPKTPPATAHTIKTPAQKKGRAPRSITDRGALPIWRTRHLTDTQGATTYHPPNKRMRTGGAV